MIRRSTIACGAAMALTLPFAGGVATADDGNERETWGNCSADSRWELSSELTRTGGIKIEFEIDGAPVDSQWSYTLAGPSGEIAAGTALADRDGEVEVKILTTGSVDDAFNALATSGAQTCDTTAGAQTGDDDGNDGDHDTDEDGDDPRYEDDDRDGDSDDSNTYRDDDRNEAGDHQDDTRSGSRNGMVMEGYCDGPSSLTVASRRGRTTLTIDTNRRGQSWSYSLKQGKRTIKKGVGTTRRGGSLVVRTRETVTAPRATAARIGGDERCATSRAS